MSDNNSVDTSGIIMRQFIFRFVVLLCCIVIFVLKKLPPSPDANGYSFPAERPATNRSFAFIEGFSTSLEVLSKSLVVRRAYFDNRKRQGHNSTVVFMLDMKRSLTSDVFIGCRIGQRESSKIRFRHSIAYKWAINNRHVTQNVAFVDCFDVDGISDGDPAF